LGDCPRATGHLGAVPHPDDVDLHVAQRQDVTERNEMRGLFGRLNSSQTRGGEHIAFRDLIFRNQLEGFALELDFSLRDGSAGNARFRGYIDHLRPAVGADMGETWHTSATDRDHLPVWLIILPEIVLLRFTFDDIEEKL